MRRNHLLWILALVATARVAQAQSFSQCNSWYTEWRLNCHGLQTTMCEALEKSLFQCNTHAQAHATVAMPSTVGGVPDGSLQRGVRKLYDASAVQHSVSDGSYFSTVNGARLGSRAALAPIYPQYESDSPGINSCSEYAYKQYYQASRFADALTAYNGDYESAYGLIMSGAQVPGARALPPLPGAALRDFDGRPLVDRHNNQIGVFSPTPITHTMNAFRNFGSLQFMNGVVSAKDAGTLAEAQAAAVPVSVNSDDWSFARLMHGNADVASLSPSERDSIASRVTAFTHAVEVFDSQFGVCIGQSFAMQVGPAANDVGLAARIRQLVQQSLGGGYTDPVELQMLNQLTNTITRPAVIQKLATADATQVMPDLVTARYYYNTRSGSTIARMANLDSAALNRVIDGFASGNLQGPACGPAFAALTTATTLIVAEYNRADHGCLGTHLDGTINQKCEWSETLFVRDVIERVRSAESNADHAHQDCVELYGETLQTAAPVAPDRTTLSSFDGALQAYKAQLIQQRKDAPRTSNMFADGLGQHDHKAGSWGDSSFGASYSYDFDWGVRVSQLLDQTTIPCLVDGEVDAKLNVTGMVEGQSAQILDGDVSAFSKKNSSGANFHINLSVLDEAVYSPPDVSLTNPYSDSKMSHHKQTLFNQTILIVFIPVTIDAGVSFDYGFAMTASLKQVACTASSNPSLSLVTTAGPRAGVSAYVSASVDAFIASVGVECDLTLVEVDLPATISLAVAPDPKDNNTLSVQYSTALDLVLEELSGKLSLVIQVLGVDVYDDTLFSWDGIKQKFNLWADQKSYPLAILNANTL